MTKLNEGVWLGPYIARKKLIIPQGPKQKPAMLRLAEHEVFSFDGDEPIDIRRLLEKQFIMPYTGDLDKLEAK